MSSNYLIASMFMLLRKYSSEIMDGIPKSNDIMTVLTVVGMVIKVVVTIVLGIFCASLFRFIKNMGNLK